MFLDLDRRYIDTFGTILSMTSSLSQISVESFTVERPWVLVGHTHKDICKHIFILLHTGQAFAAQGLAVVVCYRYADSG